VAGLASGSVKHAQWRFTPTSSDKLDLHSIEQHTEEKTLAQKERRDAFKKKLLLENNQFLPRKADTPVALDESESEESDPAFRELNEMFSNNVTGKGKDSPSAKLPKKRTPAGPGGQAYTPLENQVSVISLMNLMHILLCV
jgi:DNA mismatch repair protein MSH3